MVIVIRQSCVNLRMRKVKFLDDVIDRPILMKMPQRYIGNSDASPSYPWLSASNIRGRNNMLIRDK